MLDAIANPLGSILAAIFQILPSLGLSIIGLTILVNLVLFPLTLKQTRATRAFSAIQPEVRRLQAEHKEDPQKLQQEMMKLQREHGATPGGCLGPMLIQMPIWFALFRMLREPLRFVPEGSALGDAIEAGRTTFAGMELTATPSEAFGDGVVAVIPYVIVILVMVATQFFQQMYTQQGQTEADNPQVRATQNVTKFLPVLFGVFAWNFVAGLIVYWATSNLFRLGQQAVIYRIDGRPERPDPAGGTDKDSAEPKAPAKPQGSAKKRKRRRRK